MNQEGTLSLQTHNIEDMVGAQASKAVWTQYPKKMKTTHLLRIEDPTTSHAYLGSFKKSLHVKKHLFREKQGQQNVFLLLPS